VALSDVLVAVDPAPPLRLRVVEVKGPEVFEAENVVELLEGLLESPLADEVVPRRMDVLSSVRGEPAP